MPDLTPLVALILIALLLPLPLVDLTDDDRDPDDLVRDLLERRAPGGRP